MDESRVRGMAEIEGYQIEQIDNQEQFGPPKVRTDPEHGPAKLQQVVDDEMASYVGSRGDIVAIFGEEVPYISDLENPHYNPRER